MGKHPENLPPHGTVKRHPRGGSKLNFDVGAYKINHVDHGIDVPEAVGLPDHELALVVDRLDAGIAQPVLDCVEDVLLMPLNLSSQVLDYLRARVRRSPVPFL